jgi:CubicO group peptidase (beta-lactamase class C family)
VLAYSKGRWPVIGLLAFALCLASASAHEGSVLPSARYARFNDDVNLWRLKLLVPGISLAVFDDTGPIVEYNDGDAVLGSARKVSSATLFPIASITKTMAAVRILQLAREGRLSLDDRLSKYRVSQELAPEATVRNLMSHTSDPPPGTRFLYSGRLYGRLAEVAQTAATEPFTTQLNRYIFRVAHMDSSYDNLRDVPPSVASTRLATPYTVASGAITPAPYPSGSTNAASGVVSDVRDLVRYVEALIHEKLLDTSLVEEMFTPLRLKSGEASPYGLGWFVTSYAGVKVVWGYGQETTFSSLLLYVPQRHLGTVLLANSDALSDPFWLIFGNLLHSPFAVAFLQDIAFPKKQLDPAYLQLDEGFADAWLGENDGAARHLRGALQELPPFARNDPAVLAVLARSSDATLLKIGANVAKNLLAVDPNNPRTRFDYAVLLVRTKRFNAAAQLLKPLAAHSDPSLPWIRSMAASMLQRLPPSYSF